MQEQINNVWCKEIERESNQRANAMMERLDGDGVDVDSYGDQRSTKQIQTKELAPTSQHTSPSNTHCHHLTRREFVLS